MFGDFEGDAPDSAVTHCCQGCLDLDEALRAWEEFGRDFLVWSTGWAVSPAVRRLHDRASALLGEEREHAE